MATQICRSVYVFFSLFKLTFALTKSIYFFLLINLYLFIFSFLHFDLDDMKSGDYSNLSKKSAFRRSFKIKSSCLNPSLSNNCIFEAEAGINI